MKNKVSYSVKITGEYRIFRDTITYYRKVVKYLIPICDIHYSEFQLLNNNDTQSYMEHLVHSTKNNDALYHFDEKFYKTPSYLRRSAISEAAGIVRSYRSNLKNWEDAGKKGKRPRLSFNHACMPCFFNKNMFLSVDDTHCLVKVFCNNDWVWREFTLRKSDMAYITNHFKEGTLSAPVIEKRNKKYALRFLVETKSELSKRNDRVCAVDLGINNDAVCSIIDKDGTVIARRFINSSIEKDHLYRILNQIKKAQSVGNRKTPKLWRYADNYNHQISVNTAKGIHDFALEYNCDVIVMEHLDTQGKKKGSKKQRLHLWRKREIQKLVESLAHRSCIRFSTVSACRTSQLAFDGTGKIKRSTENFSLCVFPTGKQYNCDLNASYNIGARYFLRHISKTISERKWLDIQAKVPECSKRTYSTLSTLIRVSAEL